MPTSMIEHAVIVCPVEFERQSLRRAGLSSTCELQCSGPGEAGISRWAAGNDLPDGAMVILAGVCGSLTPQAHAGQAYVIAEVIHSDGRRWRPALGFPVSHERGESEGVDANPSRVSITSVAKIVCDARERRSLLAATSAELVDLESCVFAEIAELRGWRWAIVRGVSDDCESPLPRQAAQWVAKNGRTRVLRVAGSILVNPTLLPVVMRTAQYSRMALHSAAAFIRSLLSEAVGETGT